MTLNAILKSPTLDLLALINKYKKEEIAKDLNTVLVKDYQELSRNNIYINNFLELVSYLYAYEQINNQKTERPSSINISLFDDAFRKKLTILRNEYVHNNPVSR